MTVRKIEVVVVAKTRMRSNICVGAVSKDSCELLRLIPAGESSQFNSWRTFEHKIGEVLNIEGTPSPNVSPPHTEDFLVSRVSKVPYQNHPETHVCNMRKWISDKCKPFVWHGPASGLFWGKLSQNANGKFFLNCPDSQNSHSMLPPRSTSFWVIPELLRFRENDRCFVGRGLAVKYVGLEKEPVRELPKGALARMSLARPWDGDGGVLKCWLQLSHYYL